LIHSLILNFHTRLGRSRAGRTRNKPDNQRRIFIFEALGYFKLGALLEVFRPLMSYKLALHVIVTFTEQVVPIHKHIILF